MTLARSAAKPFQALAILETGTAERVDFDSGDIALMCSSHNAEEKHISQAVAMLQRARLEEKDLKCGGHPSLSRTINEAWTRNGFEPTAIYNNCCAKHIGMLAAAKTINADIGNYHTIQQPVQQKIKNVVEAMSALKPDQISWGIDGCNAPAPAMPLYGLARMYAALADAADQSEKLGCTQSSRTQTLSRIFKSMSAFPELIAGEDRFCTDLGRVYRGALIGKLGADGCYGLAIRESEATEKMGAKGAVGIAIKVEDGKIDVLYAAVMEILEQLGIGTKDIWEDMSRYHSIEQKNTMGVVIGHTSFDIRVQSTKVT
ncbi:L-asparaginase II, partial [Aureobasidium melanogenum]